jgi:glycosyltransferase involved in cell wall biosynthesis
VRVLFLDPIGTLGGAEQSLLDVIASLRRVKPAPEIRVLVLEDGPLVREAEALGASTDVLPLPRALARLGEHRSRSGWTWREWLGASAAAPRWVPTFAARLRTHKPDIIHSNGLKTHLLSALARPRGVPVVWHVHDFLGARVVTRRLLPAMQRRVALGVAVSEAVATDARTVLPRLRIETVLNGVRTDRFTPGGVVPMDLDALAGLAPAAAGTLRIGLVATYASWKGHRLFLEAAHRLRKCTARFYVVGGPVYSTSGSEVTEVELRDAIRTLGLQDRCGLVPFQSEVARVHASLDIVVQASTRPEPFGRTIAEAMASARVVVASAWGGAVEQLDDGRSGLLVPPNSSEALATTLRRAIDSPDLRMYLSKQALLRARRDLDHVRIGPHLMSLYDEIIDPSRREKPCEERTASAQVHGRAR